MFSGIIETIATLKQIEQKGTNITFTFESKYANELKVDQSVAHKVTAINETLRLTNLGKLELGDKVNFERCIRLNDRLDGHIVQGHVDGKATVLSALDKDGSWEYDFEMEADFTDINGHAPEKLIIQKGSITINGTSLTVTHITDRKFGVAIIPYTYEHTSFHTLQVGHTVNIELDVLGKYVARLTSK
jgi:riboflavin synthase